MYAVVKVIFGVCNSVRLPQLFVVTRVHVFNKPGDQAKPHPLSVNRDSTTILIESKEAVVV
jgi:hypothetical protein